MSHQWADSKIPFLVPQDICVKCGVKGSELLVLPFEWSPAEAPCTGNAYICRVARKLIAINPQHTRTWREGNGTRTSDVPFPQPWQLTDDEMASIVWKLISLWWYRDPEHSLVQVPTTIRDLTLAAPIPCPILADALQEAGCEDEALLAALRIP